MKNIFYATLVVFSLVFVQESKAQVSVNINIGNQPLWGPVGYDYVRYYYMPEINAYYNVSNRRYTYWRGNKWVTKSKLPKEYRNFDLYRTYKVVVNERDPWHRHQHMSSRYRGYAHNHSQIAIRDSRRASHVSKHRDNRRGDHYKKDKGKRNQKHHDERRYPSHRR